MQEATPLTTERAVSTRISVIAALLLVAGLTLRLYFFHAQPFISTDSQLYQDIAHNWLRFGIYGQTIDGTPQPTLIRLPGYPAILAACMALFDQGRHNIPGSLHSFIPVLSLQILADLTGCILCALIARKLLGDRAALITLAAACLCPFTANYTAVALTESFTLFFLTLSFFALQRYLANQRWADLALLAFAIASSILMRPDQGLLAVAALPAIFFTRSPQKPSHRIARIIVCSMLIAIPFAAWTARNLHTFGIFQPLAPKQAVDPGESAPLGFERWFRTWAIDFNASQDAYWKYPDETILMSDLPERAFDTPAQRAATEHVLQQNAATHTFDSAVEAQFNSIASERIHANPLRYYLLLPTARLADMFVHPRIEMLPVAEHWTEYSAHKGQTIFAFAYGALNIFYFAWAAFGVKKAWRTDRLFITSACAYIALRCLLLLTLDNAEQRYTLEFFPLLFLFIGAAFTAKKKGLQAPR